MKFAIPLAAIKWTVQLLNADREDEASKKNVELVLSELDRIDSIVGEFLMLAKPHHVAFLEKDLRSLLQLTVTLMNVQAHRHKVQIFLDIAQDVPNVRCDENQLKQVFINFIKNAIEAMPYGGELRIVVERVSEGVQIRFVDQGIGIPEEILSKLGEPFYTTKEKGTGLGLMVSHKIVQDHHGTLIIKSKVGEGTEIAVVLPAFDAELWIHHPVEKMG